jgi:hypothetical protein
MEQLPIYISIVFILTTILTLALLYNATNYSKPVIIVVLLWLALQAVISLTGFYTVINVMPPRFALLLLPPIVLVAVMFFTKKGRQAMDGYNAKQLTLLHIVRIPVELSLYWLFLHKTIPGIMTFEGRNFDILCGLTAPLVYYFGYVKNTLNKSVLIAWNIVCLLLLANIAAIAVLSAPLPIQQFAFNQPNIALLYFPFIWLPCCIVPVVLFAHVVALRRLMEKTSEVNLAL